MQKNRWIRRALVAALFVAAAGCVMAAPGHLEVGSRLPDLEFPNLEGETSSFRDYQGKRYILHVFASW